jgi:hypothetical protein
MMIRLLRTWLNFKVLLGGILFALVIFASFLFLLWSAKVKNASQVPGTAILNIILAPTATPPAPITTPTPTPTPTPESGQIPLPSGEIKTGDYVQVAGTGGDGLRLHVTAGVSSKVNYVAIEAEVFLVKEGPSVVDGYTWWYLQDPYTSDAVGWGVANYLAVVQNP